MYNVCVDLLTTKNNLELGVSNSFKSSYLSIVLCSVWRGCGKFVFKVF